MSWYKLAQTSEITRITKTWLLQAARGPVDLQQVQADIDAKMQEVSNEEEYSSAVMNGQTMAMGQTGQQYLNDYQVGVINLLNSRYSNMHSQQPDNSQQQQNMPNNNNNEEPLI